MILDFKNEDALTYVKSLQESIEDLDFAILDIITQESFIFSKEDLGL